MGLAARHAAPIKVLHSRTTISLTSVPFPPRARMARVARGTEKVLAGNPDGPRDRRCIQPQPPTPCLSFATLIGNGKMENSPHAALCASLR